MESAQKMAKEAQPDNETDNERYDRLVSPNPLTLDLLCALSGDRPLLEPEKILLDELHAKRGSLFYSDLLFLVTHQHFPTEVAEDLWTRLPAHKYQLSNALGRNIKLVVATLDYLSNTTAEMKEVTLISEHNIGKLIRLYQHDGLPGLLNHAHFYQSLRTHLGYYTRYGTAVSILMIDIDDFKRFNDRNGHQEGDNLLFLLGQLLQIILRDVDICCRYGGEEFAAILPLTTAGQALPLAERIRAKIADTLFNGEHKVTVSIGVAESGKECDTDIALVKKADDALYQAKANGKNQVVFKPAA